MANIISVKAEPRDRIRCGLSVKVTVTPRPSMKDRDPPSLVFPPLSFCLPMKKMPTPAALTTTMATMAMAIMLLPFILSTFAKASEPQHPI